MEGQINLTLPLDYESVGWLLALVRAHRQAEKRVKAAESGAGADGGGDEKITVNIAELEEPPEAPEPEDEKFPASDNIKPAPWPEAGEKATYDEIYALSAKLVQAGHTNVLKDIYTRFGARKLANVREELYGDLKRELERALDF